MYKVTEEQLGYLEYSLKMFKKYVDQFNLAEKEFLGSLLGYCISEFKEWKTEFFYLVQDIEQNFLTQKKSIYEDNTIPSISEENLKQLHNIGLTIDEVITDIETIIRYNIIDITSEAVIGKVIYRIDKSIDILSTLLKNISNS